jgi:hypothetical protein
MAIVDLPNDEPSALGTPEYVSNIAFWVPATADHRVFSYGCFGLQ